MDEDDVREAIQIPLLPGLGGGDEDGYYQIRSGFQDATTNILSKQVLHITSVMCILSVLVKVILVIVEAASEDPKYGYAVLDLILTIFFCIYLFWAVVEGIRSRNKQFCYMGLLDWYLLVTITFTCWCLFGIGFGISDMDWAVLVPSFIFGLVEGTACYVTCKLVSHLHKNQQEERRRSVSVSSSGDPL